MVFGGSGALIASRLRAAASRCRVLAQRRGRFGRGHRSGWLDPVLGVAARLLRGRRCGGRRRGGRGHGRRGRRSGHVGHDAVVARGRTHLLVIRELQDADRDRADRRRGGERHPPAFGAQRARHRSLLRVGRLRARADSAPGGGADRVVERRRRLLVRGRAPRRVEARVAKVVRVRRAHFKSPSSARSFASA